MRSRPKACRDDVRTVDWQANLKVGPTDRIHFLLFTFHFLLVFLPRQRPHNDVRSKTECLLPD